MFLTVSGMLMLYLGFSPITSETIYSLAIIAVMVPGLWNMGRLSKTVHVLGFFTVVYMSKIECFPPQAD
ncbi:hypothetical protein FVER53590_30380 [Fusarium verticillioides]|nr:hypothetical protein FVER53590_30380 [Fusarium verticillioides]